MRAPDPALVTTSLCRLGRVRAIAHLGRNGPLDAAGPGGPFGNALFGRDSMFMAMDLMDDFPEVSRATITALAALQGVKDRVRSEEEPGRILHENRGPGPYDNPRWTYPYYGSVDATPLYVKLVDAHVQRCGSEILSDEVQDRAGNIRPGFRVNRRKIGGRRRRDWSDRRRRSHRSNWSYGRTGCHGCRRDRRPAGRDRWRRRPESRPRPPAGPCP